MHARLAKESVCKKCVLLKKCIFDLLLDCVKIKNLSKKDTVGKRVWFFIKHLVGKEV